VHTVGLGSTPVEIGVLVRQILEVARRYFVSPADEMIRRRLHEIGGLSVIHVVHFEVRRLSGDGAIPLHARQHDDSALVPAVDVEKDLGYQRAQSRFHIEPFSNLALGAYRQSAPLRTRGLRTVSANLAPGEIPVVARHLAVRALGAPDPIGGKERYDAGHAKHSAGVWLEAAQADAAHSWYRRRKVGARRADRARSTHATGLR